MSEEKTPQSDPEAIAAAIDYVLIELAGRAIEACRLADNDSRLRKIADVAIAQVKDSVGIETLIIDRVQAPPQQSDQQATDLTPMESARQQAIQQIARQQIESNDIMQAARERSAATNRQLNTLIEAALVNLTQPPTVNQ